MTVAAPRDMHRRSLLLAMMTAPAALALNGCATRRPLPEPEIVGDVPVQVPAILAPYRVVKATNAPKRVIDVHAHFFNASDVPVAGYLAGPVAHSKSGAMRELLKALAPIADWLATRAPTAAQEFRELSRMVGDRALTLSDQRSIQRRLDATRSDYLDGLSRELYEQLKALPNFVRLFNDAQGRLRQEHSALRGFAGDLYRDLDEQSLTRAMRRESQLQTLSTRELRTNDQLAHAEGALAFLGHMLSYRWMNLRAYQEAFTTEDGAFGVDRVFGALVDFDHWLSPSLRSAHADQIKVHHFLSKLSGGYLRALAAYNPWSDAVDGGKTLERVRQAIVERGFVGVKIYPPNGFRPYGNSMIAGTVVGAPSGVVLDETLLKMWRQCAQLGVPVMAHSGHSMGSDDASEEKAGPLGWSLLLKRMQSETLPRINVGHFGGDDPRYPWTQEFAALMNSHEGANFYGDLGYWEDLRCGRAGASCPAADRLTAAIKTYPIVEQRVMFGTDWFMLAMERRWDRYPQDLANTTRAMVNPELFFGANADRCFSQAKPPL